MLFGPQKYSSKVIINVEKVIAHQHKQRGALFGEAMELSSHTRRASGSGGRMLLPKSLRSVSPKEFLGLCADPAPSWPRRLERLPGDLWLVT